MPLADVQALDLLAGGRCIRYGQRQALLIRQPFQHIQIAATHRISADHQRRHFTAGQPPQHHAVQQAHAIVAVNAIGPLRCRQAFFALASLAALSIWRWRPGP